MHRAIAKGTLRQIAIAHTTVLFRLAAVGVIVVTGAPVVGIVAAVIM